LFEANADTASQDQRVGVSDETAEVIGEAMQRLAAFAHSHSAR
jgi:hypothetical protein